MPSFQTDHTVRRDRQGKSWFPLVAVVAWLRRPPETAPITEGECLVEEKKDGIKTITESVHNVRLTDRDHLWGSRRWRGAGKGYRMEGDSELKVMIPFGEEKPSLKIEGEVCLLTDSPFRILRSSILGPVLFIKSPISPVTQMMFLYRIIMEK